MPELVSSSSPLGMDWIDFIEMKWTPSQYDGEKHTSKNDWFK